MIVTPMWARPVRDRHDRSTEEHDKLRLHLMATQGLTPGEAYRLAAAMQERKLLLDAVDDAL